MNISLGDNFSQALSEQYDREAQGSGNRKRIAPVGPQLMYVEEIEYHVAGDNNKANHDYITIEWVNAAGQTCDDFISLSPKALWKFASRMQALNLTASQTQNMYLTAFLRRAAEVVVEHTQNGNYTDASAQYVNRPEKIYDGQDPIDISLKVNEFTVKSGVRSDHSDLPF